MPAVGRCEVSWAFRAIGAVTRRVPRSALCRVYRMPRLARLGRHLLNTAATGNRLAEIRIAGGPLEGAWLVIDSRCEKSLWLGTYELWVQERLVRMLRPQSVAWDVGAYIGYHTVLMSRILDDGTVVAFEPDAANRQRLRCAIERNGLTNVVVVPAAVGAASGTGRTVQADSSNKGATRIVEGSGPCRVMTLDDALDEQPEPTLVKMDVEGAEFAALRGAPRLVHHIKPSFILELHGERGRAAAQLLTDAGYRVERFGKGVEVRGDLPVGGPQHVVAIP